MLGNILVVGEDRQLVNSVSGLVKELGYRVISDSIENLVGRAYSEKFDLIIVEASIICDGKNMPVWNEPDFGILSERSVIRVLIDQLQAIIPTPEFIFVSKCRTSGEARFALENGAVDYIHLPEIQPHIDAGKLDWETIKTRLSEAISLAMRLSGGTFWDGINFEGIVGPSPQLRRACIALAQATKDLKNVLITGEIGTGRTLFANKLHENGFSKEGPFVVFDCRVTSEKDAEAELFGNSKEGGKMAAAAGGTLFLYSIDHLPTSCRRNYYGL